MRTFHFPSPLDREHRLAFFGAEASEPDQAAQTEQMKEAEALMDGSDQKLVETAREADKTANDAKEKTDADLADMKKDVPEPTTYEVSYEGKEGEDVAIAEEDLANALKTPPKKEWPDGHTSDSHADDGREDTGSPEPETNSSNAQNEGLAGYRTEGGGRVDTSGRPVDENGKGETGEEGAKGTSGKQGEGEVGYADVDGGKARVRAGSSLDRGTPARTETDPPKPADGKAETDPPKPANGKTETDPPKPTDGKPDPNDSPETNPTSGLPKGKSEKDTGLGSGEDEDPKKPETNPPKPGDGKTETDPAKPAEGKPANGKTETTPPKVETDPAKAEGTPEKDKEKGEKEKVDPNETNGQRIDRQMKDAQKVLGDDKASSEERFTAALTMAGLAIERIFGKVNGTLNQKAEVADAGDTTEKSKESKAEKSDDATNEKPSEAATEQNDQVREARLKDELKKADSGETLITEKQTKLDAKVTKVHDEMDELDGEIDGYDDTVNDLEKKKDNLQDDARDYKQELDAMDAKGKTGKEFDKERADLQEKIRETNRQIKDVETDISGTKQKIENRKEERAKLEADMNSDKEVVDLREDIRVLKAMKERGEKEAKDMNETLKPALKELAKNIEGLSPESIKVELDPKTFGLRITVEGGVVDMLKTTLKDAKVDFAKAIDGEGVVTDLKAMMDIFKKAAAEKAKTKEK